MHGSVLLVTMSSPPPPRGTPPGICNFFSLAGLFPTPGHAERDNSPPRAPVRPHIHFLLHLFDPYKSKTTRFHNVYEHFPEFFSEGYGCHNENENKEEKLFKK